METTEIRRERPARGSGRRPSSRKVVAAAAATTMTLLASACGGGGGGDAADAEGGSGDAGKLPEATTYGTLADAPEDPDPQGSTDGEVVHPKRELKIYDEVDGEAFARLPEQQISSPTWVPVIEREGDWAQVLLPTRPNGAAGWIKAGESDVETAQNDYVVNVDRESFTLEIVESGEQIGEYTVGLGKEEHPTPAGRAYIIASIQDQVKDYSPIVLPLSAHSSSHETYGGGPGTVGIHTWPDDSVFGQRSSDGCIRIDNNGLDALAELPLGTMVNIT